jgi:preprotein translocase subunit SecE
VAYKREKEKERGKTGKKQNFLARWWRETSGELNKVSWPTRQEAWRLTRIVIVVLVAMSALLGVLDFLFSKVITFILS